MDNPAFKNKLAKMSHLKVASTPEALYFPKSISEIASLSKNIDKLDSQNFLFAGGCSNILFYDVSNYTIISDQKLPRIFNIKNNELTVSSNYNINEVIMKLKNQSLGGLEFLIGIPAHIGGLVRMNAGAFDKTVSGTLNWVEIINFKGQKRKITAEDIVFGYRKTNLKGYITKVNFKIRKTSKQKISKIIDNYIHKRMNTQPLKQPNLGSIFKNPKDNFAGRLIEKCGIKGKKCGGAQISEKHANFFINTGAATTKDFLRLIDFAKNKVKKKFSIELETEIHITR